MQEGPRTALFLCSWELGSERGGSEIFLYHDENGSFTEMSVWRTPALLSPNSLFIAKEQCWPHCMINEEQPFVTIWEATISRHSCQPGPIVQPARPNDQGELSIVRPHD